MKRTILAIDDSIALRMFIQKTLTEHPEEFALHLAKDATEGLGKAASVSPELILLDYILPEMTGAEVCAKLQEKPETAGIPIVLMSSNVHDIKQAEARFTTIVKSIAKPFTPDLLTSTVRHALRDIPAKSPVKSEPETSPAMVEPPLAKSSPAALVANSTPKAEATDTPAAPAEKPVTTQPLYVFHGRTEFFPLYRVFTAVSEGGLTGILHLKSSKQAADILFEKGRPVLSTTCDGEGYMNAGAYPLTGAQAAGLTEAIKRQAEDGQPVFVTLSQAGLLPAEQVPAACREQGAKYLSQFWTSGTAEFSFEAMENVPAIRGSVQPVEIGVDLWMLESLRHVREQALSALAWGDLSGVPIYTRHGYERIQELKLTREEASLLGQVGSATLSEMAIAAKMTPERAQEILYRFLCLEIFEYWPAAVLRGEV